MKRVDSIFFNYEPISGQGYATFKLHGEPSPQNTPWLSAANFTGLVSLRAASEVLFYTERGLFTNMPEPDTKVLDENMDKLLNLE